MNGARSPVGFALALTLGVALSGCSLLNDADLELCQEAVANRLKAPATAEFSDFQQEELDGRLTVVRGVVDAENGFGAKIRSSFKCHVLDDKEATVMYID
jgi:hypothetical protein